MADINSNKVALENEAVTRNHFSDFVNNKKKELSTERVNLNKLRKELRALNDSKRTEKNPNNIKRIEKDIGKKESEIQLSEAKIKSYKKEIEALLAGIEEQEKKITRENPNVRGYIEYAKAKAFSDKVEQANNQISVNKRINETLNANPQLKKMSVLYLQKQEEVNRTKESLAQARKEKNTGKITAQESLLRIAEREINDVEKQIKEWVNNYNLTNIRSINSQELLTALKSLSIVKNASGKIDIEAGFNQRNTQLEKDSKRNERFRNLTIENAYQKEGIKLDGIPGYQYSNLQKYSMSEQQFRAQRAEEIKDELTNAFGLNKPIPMEYKGVLNKLRHPIKSFKEFLEGRKIKKERKELEPSYQKAYNEALANLGNEYNQLIQTENNSKSVVTESDISRYSFGEKTNGVVQGAIKKEMNDLNKKYPDASTTR